MMKKVLILFLAAFALAACGNEASTHDHEGEGEEVHAEHDGHEHDGHDHEGEATEEGDGKHFGAEISADGAISYAALLDKMQGQESVEGIKVEGLVEAVCQTKGCWMNIDGGEGKEDLFVQFEDYGFFMPKDIAGRKVVMEGRAYREVTTVDELRHFAEDEGKSAEEIAAITEPLEELKFMATGVVLLDKEGK
jgi:hypothetical protein